MNNTLDLMCRSCLPAILATVLLTACGQPAPDIPAPEKVFLGRFVTLDESTPETEAIAVKGGRIAASGRRDDILALAGDDTETINVPGIGVPGWVDAHVHVAGLGSLLEKLNVQAIDKQTILERVAAAAETTPPGEWIIGRGWDQGFFDVPVQPTAADLDAVAPEHPVILTRIGGHSVWVNSRALELAGIDDDTSDPRGGRIVRDASGRATGMLLEKAEELVRAVMPDTDTPEYLERRIRAALDQYSRWGLTGVHDAGASLDEIGVYKKLLEAGELPVRVYAMALGNEAVEHYLRRGPEVDLGDGRLTVRSFKIAIDGALGARGAEMSEPYSDAPETTGLRQMEDQEIDAFIAAARAAGFQVNAHVIGDLGVERALDAIERTGVPASERFRLEHASIISPPNLSRFAGLGAIASMQPVFVGEYQRWGESRVGAKRAAWIMPMRDLLATGAILAAGTDFPASDSGDPRTTLYGLVTRKGFDAEPEGGWFPDQTVNVDTALRAMSEGPAFAAFREDRLGKLAVGRYADFTVLGEDPRTAPVESLLTLPVLMTVVGGQVTFDAADQSRFPE
jgi:predicted amidohydrolase YtcJ